MSAKTADRGDPIGKPCGSDYPRFRIYRKPTHWDLCIHTFSSHADKVKSGVMTDSDIQLRSYRICDMKFLGEVLLAFEREHSLPSFRYK